MYHCNRNYARDQGIEEADLVGKTDFDFFPKHLAEKYREDDVKVFRTETTIEVEESYFTGGEEIIIQTVKTPIRNEQGQVSGVIGYFFGISPNGNMPKKPCTWHDFPWKMRRWRYFGSIRKA